MVELKNISFSYGEYPCLEEVSIRIKEEECIVIIGPSGNGKTSLIRTINGLIPHYFAEGQLEGDVYLDSQKANELAMWERGKMVGSVFQDPRTQFFSDKVEGEIAFACENYGLDHGDIVSYTDDIIRELKLEHLKGKPLSALSSGERQMIAIASSMVTKAKILIFDEPSANLDSEGIEKLKRLLKVLKKKGTTMVFAEHRIYYLMDIADRFLYIENGKITRQFSKEHIKKIGLPDKKKLGIRHPDKTTIKSLLEAAYQQDKQPLVHVDSVSYSIHGKSIIQNCSLVGYPGQIIAIMGGNGAGKTTLAKVISGLCKEKTGNIFLCGKKTAYRKRNKNVWYSANETSTQFFTNSLEEEVLIDVERTPEALDKVRHLLKFFDLYTIRHKHPYALSGGQKQRLSIACGLLSERDVLILDEPSSGLDYKNMRNMAAAIKYAASLGKTILLITHDNELVNACCTHYYNL